MCVLEIPSMDDFMDTVNTLNEEDTRQKTWDSYEFCLRAGMPKLYVEREDNSIIAIGKAEKLENPIPATIKHLEDKTILDMVNEMIDNFFWTNEKKMIAPLDDKYRYMQEMEVKDYLDNNDFIII